MKARKSSASFFYGVAHEARAAKAMRSSYSMLYHVDQAAGPPRWEPPPLEDSIDAIGPLEKLTNQMKEIYNGNSSLHQPCHRPWDHEYMAQHHETEGKG